MIILSKLADYVIATHCGPTRAPDRCGATVATRLLQATVAKLLKALVCYW
jgi:hypothetical protein